MKQFEISKYTIGLTKDLVKINTENPPGSEIDAANFLYDELCDLDIEASVQKLSDNRANVIGIIDSGVKGSTLMLNSHIDTVPIGDLEYWDTDPLSGTIEKQKLYGRGACDAKGSVAAMMGTLKMIIQKQKKFSGKIIFTAVADEETGGEGAKEVIKHGYKPDFVVVGEPTDLRICVGNKGRGEIKVEVTGKSCHASIPDKGINAIEIGSKIAYHISKYKDGYGEENKYFGKSTGSITMIEGGLAPNIIPETCKLTLDWRFIPGDNIDKVKKKLEEDINEVTLGLSDVSFKITKTHFSPPTQIDLDSILITSSVNALDSLGLNSELIGFPATTDLSRISELCRTDGIIIGPGSINLAHKNNEFVYITEIEKAVEIYDRIITFLLCNTSSYPLV